MGEGGYSLSGRMGGLLVGWVEGGYSLSGRGGYSLNGKERISCWVGRGGCSIYVSRFHFVQSNKTLNSESITSKETTSWPPEEIR